MKNKQNNLCYTIDFEAFPKSKKPSGRGNLDTLGQIGTTHYVKQSVELSGLGSCLKDKSRLTTWARKKHISFVIISELIKRAQKKGDEEFEKYLKIGSQCLDKVVVSNNRMYGRYCRSRPCLVCNAIRKAQMINRYKPIIESWEEPYFVTLSKTTCYANDLDDMMKEMIVKFRLVLERLKKRHQRGKGPQIVGIKSLECNFNAKKRTYNPHFHLIVKNREIKAALIVEWLRVWKSAAGPAGQHNRRIKNLDKDLIETIKYGSKIFSEPDPNAKNKKKATRYVYISALYNIYSAMRGLRLFERFGFQKAGEDIKTSSTQRVNIYDSYSYYPEYLDWVNEETGAMLSGFVPEAKLKDLLDNRLINTIE